MVYQWRNKYKTIQRSWRWSNAARPIASSPLRVVVQAADDGRVHALVFHKVTHRVVSGNRQAVLLPAEAVDQVEEQNIDAVIENLETGIEFEAADEIETNEEG